ncbi:unnamed protein product [Cyprideis torosa]|uniref:Uncharacterized protein n=1 Tax=Cyprideis torosa TaxID=163714 RepID=A0A7R8WGC4_9CRUS|nr:unnamed protein product [Cyprideis torosa]CAG0892808.1 unnamed protein product [Cyprideis torosa]
MRDYQATLRHQHGLQISKVLRAMGSGLPPFLEYGLIKRSPTRKDVPIFQKYCMVSFSAATAECFVTPVDLVKTRLQVQGEGGAPVTRGVLTTARDIIVEEGPLSIFFSLEATLPRQFVFSGSRVVLYEEFRNRLLMRNPDGSTDLWKAVMCSVSAGIIGQFIAAPFDLMKVNLQMEGRRMADGLPPRFGNIFSCAKYQIEHGGIRGMWRGASVSCQRAALVTTGDLATYDVFKYGLMNYFCMRSDKAITHFLASFASGFCTAIFACPIDVMKSRILNQPLDPVTGKGILYFNTPDCFIKTLRSEGPLAFYKGEGGAPVKRGITRTMIDILREEGPLKMYFGLEAALPRQLLVSGSRTLVYDIIRGDILYKNSDGSFDLWKAISTSMVSGALAQFIGVPFDLAKVNLMMEGRRIADGEAPRYRNVIHFWKKQYASGGIRGLWRGGSISCQRAAMVSSGDIGMYDVSKHVLIGRFGLPEDWTGTHVMASLCAGICTALFSNPMDVVKSRFMNQPIDARTGEGLLYKHSLDCTYMTLNKEGPRAFYKGTTIYQSSFYKGTTIYQSSFYKGLLAAWLRHAPWILCFWVSHEQVRKYVGMDHF